MHRFMLRVDGKELALVARVEHVADQHVAQRAAPFAGTNDPDRAGLEERGEIVLVFHGENLSG